MKTKKIYVAPTMEAVKIESVTLLAGSGMLVPGATIGDREDGGDVGGEWTNS